MAWKRRYACAWLRSSSRRRFRTRCSISGRPSASNSASTSSQQPLQLPELVAAERALNETRNCGVALAELERALSIAETVRAAPLLRSIRCRIADVHHLSGNYVAECKQLELAVGDRDRDHDNGVEDVLLRALNVAKLRTGAEPTPLDDDDERETTSVTRLCNKAVNALVLWESDDRDSARHKLDAAIDAAKATTDARRLAGEQPIDADTDTNADVVCVCVCAAFLQVLRSHWGLVSGVPTALEDAEQAVEVLREDTSMAELPDDRGLLVGLQTLGQAQMKLLPANQRTKHAQDTLTEALKLAETKVLLSV